jgi:hypothetical protein
MIEKNLIDGREQVALLNKSVLMYIFCFPGCPLGLFLTLWHRLW